MDHDRGTVRADRPLENYANNSSPPSDLGFSRRESRYARRAELWFLSDLERVRKCGRVRTAGYVAVRKSGPVVGLAGLVTCGSVWADPVCNAKIMARRALEVGAAVAAWQAQGGSVAFATFTMRHRKGQGLPTLWDALSYAWGATTSGMPWHKLKAQYGVAGWLRVVEVTWGRNGWHVHIHALLFLDAKATDHTVELLHGRMFTRWSAALERKGLATPLAIAQDARLIAGPADKALAEYFTKATDPGHAIGLELTQSQTKSTRQSLSTRPQWSILDEVLSGDADSLDRWHEWEKGSKGRRQMTWAQGSREMLGLRGEKSDEEVAEEEVGTADDALVWITADGWDGLVARPSLIPKVLAAAESGGLSGVRVFLDSHGVEYRMPGSAEGEAS
jgi:hypothetical protein